jgi:hypothetical protein
LLPSEFYFEAASDLGDPTNDGAIGVPYASPRERVIIFTAAKNIEKNSRP